MTAIRTRSLAPRTERESAAVAAEACRKLRLVVGFGILTAKSSYQTAVTEIP